jgi:hypothetical protein
MLPKEEAFALSRTDSAHQQQQKLYFRSIAEDQNKGAPVQNIITP